MKATFSDRLLLCLALGMPMASTGFAWGPIAHYVAGIGISDFQPYQNLPDLWSSRQQISGWVYWGYEATEYFGWSHACQRTGTTKIANRIVVILSPLIDVPALVYPKPPTTYGQPPGVERPGRDMGEICINKLMPTNRNEWQYGTAAGFAGHNGADSVVHFGYFLGNSPTDWAVHHNRKERWAEYVVFLSNGGTWDSDGKGVWNQTLSCGGDPGIICLAQKVHRKNRQTVDKTPDPGNDFVTIQVESSVEIAVRIAAMESEHAGYVQGLSRSDYDGFWVHVADLLGWNEADAIRLNGLAAIAAASEMSEI